MKGKRREKGRERREGEREGGREGKREGGREEEKGKKNKGEDPSQQVESYRRWPGFTGSLAALLKRDGLSSISESDTGRSGDHDMEIM